MYFKTIYTGVWGGGVRGGGCMCQCVSASIRVFAGVRAYMFDIKLPT